MLQCVTRLVGRRVTLRDPSRSRPGLVGAVAAPTSADLDYAREVYTPYGLGPDHGQVLVRWQPDQPEKGTWHWAGELRELDSAARPATSE